MYNFIIFIRRLEKAEMGGPRTIHGKCEMHAEFWVESLEERDNMRE
jgi:hypothetical protein